MTCAAIGEAAGSWIGENRQAKDRNSTADHALRVAGQEVLPIVESIDSIGMDAERACRRVGIEVADLAHPACWIDIGEITALLDHVARETEDDLVGLHLAERASPHSFLQYLGVAQPTVDQFWERLVSFQRLSFDRPTIERQSGNGFALLALVGEQDAGAEVLGEYWLASVYLTLQRVTGPRAGAAEVWLRGPRASRAEYERIFGCRVRDRQPMDGVLFSAAALDQPVLTANAAVAQHLEEVAAVLLRATAAGTFSERVRAVIRSLQMAERPCERGAAARALGMTARTLQRRLEAEGSNFRGLLDDVRREVALTLVSDPTVLLSDISLRCGFSDETAFNRAFHRWTGDAPRTYRRNIGSTAEVT